MCGGETLVLDDLISRNVVIYLGGSPWLRGGFCFGASVNVICTIVFDFAVMICHEPCDGMISFRYLFAAY